MASSDPQYEKNESSNAKAISLKPGRKLPTFTGNPYIVLLQSSVISISQPYKSFGLHQKNERDGAGKVLVFFVLKKNEFEPLFSATCCFS